MAVLEDGKFSSLIILAHPPSYTSSEGRKHMANINQNIVLAAPGRKGILVHPSMGRRSHLNNDTLACLGPVVAHRALIRSSSRHRLVRQRIRDAANQGQLGNGPVLGSAPRALLVHHAEARKVPAGGIPSVVIRASIVEIRAQLHHSKGSCNTGEVIPAGLGSSAIWWLAKARADPYFTFGKIQVPARRLTRHSHIGCNPRFEQQQFQLLPPPEAVPTSSFPTLG